jgi:hypothetical protein
MVFAILIVYVVVFVGLLNYLDRKKVSPAIWKAVVFSGAALLLGFLLLLAFIR